jgi:hypothetical protein
MIDRRTYPNGTSIVQRFPFGTFIAGRALCSDGKVRSLARIAQTADTFFSVPAAVKVNGRTVSGYVTPDADAGIIFHAYTYGRNGHVLAREASS